jgi:Mg2+-importing ATPase
VIKETSRNFGTILSADAASALLPFLPILASQLLLNDLLYDSGQLAGPTDNVDPDQPAKRGRCNIAAIRRFMLLFGPLGSLFDFLTFLLGGFHAGPELLRSGWLVESLITQTAVVFAIRARRAPFFWNRQSRPLTLSALALIDIAKRPIFAQVDGTAPAQPSPRSAR